MSFMVEITRIGKSQEALMSGRWKTNYSAFLSCGHDSSFGSRKPIVGSKTHCKWCEIISKREGK
jgi:hypothetical protein